MSMSVGAISLSFRVECEDPDSEIFETFFDPCGAIPFSLNEGDSFEYVDTDFMLYTGKVCKKTHRVSIGRGGNVGWELVVILSEATSNKTRP